MAGIKISDLPAAPSSTLTDVLPADQGATTYKETLQQILTLFQANGAALTRTNDTNVTMTLGGAPTISLFNAVSMTLGWTGSLAVGRGGTGNTTFTAYSVICAGTTATGAFQNVVGVGNSGEQLTSNGPGALPTWQPSSGITPSALTKVDDTNVTLTLGGTPATALLQATSLTAGWTGQLSVARGGTGLAALTAHYLLIGNGTTALTLLAPNATSGIPLISQGASADPTYGTAVVAGGGTGNVTFTAYSLICAGTTATGAFQNVSGVGTSNQVLVSQGPGALPQWGAVPGLSPAALTKTDDTNVTLTLGGTPSTALLQATSITAGWTGQLGLTRGGTAASLTASNGGIVYSTASALAILSGTATAGQILRSGATGAPTWSTATYPATAGTSGNVIKSDGTNFSSVALSTLFTAPTQQRFTSGSGTYTTPTSPAPLYLRVRMVGGGGGGAGSGTATGTAAGAGGNTTFGSSLLTCNGGGAGVFGLTGGAGGGAGGSASISAPAYGTALTGGSGGGNAFKTVGTSNFSGAMGASSFFGGAGGGGQNQVAGSAAIANSGSGGGGAGDPNATATSVPGTGGGAGGFIDAIIAAPSASYAYAIGAAGTAGAAGTLGLAGGAGGSGYIEVTEYYQ